MKSLYTLPSAEFALRWWCWGFGWWCHRRNKSKGSREKKVARKRDKLGRTYKSKEKKRRQRSSEKDKDTDGSRRKTRDREKERQNRKERHRKHQNEGGKQRSTEKLAEVISNPDRDLLRSAPRTQLQVCIICKIPSFWPVTDQQEASEGVSKKQRFHAWDCVRCFCLETGYNGRTRAAKGIDQA